MVPSTGSGNGVLFFVLPSNSIFLKVMSRIFRVSRSDSSSRSAIKTSGIFIRIKLYVAKGFFYATYRGIGGILFASFYFYAVGVVEVVGVD